MVECLMKAKRFVFFILILTSVGLQARASKSSKVSMQKAKKDYNSALKKCSSMKNKKEKKECQNNARDLFDAYKSECNSSW